MRGIVARVSIQSIGSYNAYIITRCLVIVLQQAVHFFKFTTCKQSFLIKQQYLFLRAKRVSDYKSNQQYYYFFIVRVMFFYKTTVG
ncbi:MAG: hypothetical protein UZ12_BCD005000476 [Bacteroidetes bacterium OLB12]|nr:MAG: hypothetical protein UZ12_BCD005000476 [Bacteroidetes bacterium OLB12]